MGSSVSPIPSSPFKPIYAQQTFFLILLAAYVYSIIHILVDFFYVKGHVNVRFMSFYCNRPCYVWLMSSVSRLYNILIYFIFFPRWSFLRKQPLYSFRVEVRPADTTLPTPALWAGYIRVCLVICGCIRSMKSFSLCVFGYVECYKKDEYNNWLTLWNNWYWF